MELLANIEHAIDLTNDVKAMRDELAADPTLAKGDYWRDRLETLGYQISTLLSAYDDDDAEE